jgi:hypothetical protein
VGVAESGQETKSSELQEGCRSARDELQEAAVGTGSTGRSAVEFASVRGSALLSPSTTRPYYERRSTDYSGATDSHRRILQEYGDRKAIDRRMTHEPNKRERAGEDYHCWKPQQRRVGNNRNSVNADGTPRAKRVEMGVDLCPGSSS